MLPLRFEFINYSKEFYLVNLNKSTATCVGDYEGKIYIYFLIANLLKVTERKLFTIVYKC